MFPNTLEMKKHSIRLTKSNFTQNNHVNKRIIEVKYAKRKTLICITQIVINQNYHYKIILNKRNIKN